MSHANAVRELWASSGSQFDPNVVPPLVRAASKRSAGTADQAASGAQDDVVDFAGAGASGGAGDPG